MKITVSRSLLAGTVTILCPMVISAAQALELRITGKIIPDACLTFFSNDGVIDYGRQLLEKTGTALVLARKAISLAVSCSTPSRVAIRLIDNRADASHPTMHAVAARYRHNDYLFGLGPQAGKNAGAYTISLRPVQTPAASALMKAAGNMDAIQWSIADDPMLRKGMLYSWQPMHQGRHGDVLDFRAVLAIHTVLDGTQRTTTESKDIPLNGSATLELLYL